MRIKTIWQNFARKKKSPTSYVKDVDSSGSTMKENALENVQKTNTKKSNNDPYYVEIGICPVCGRRLNVSQTTGKIYRHKIKEEICSGSGLTADKIVGGYHKYH